jgi:hypothetical protein
MPAFHHTETLRQAFSAIAANSAPMEWEELQSLQPVVCGAAEAMKRAGVPLERAIARIKALATEVGIRRSHDRLVTNAVLWCIEEFYRNEPAPGSVREFPRHSITIARLDPTN